MADDEVIKQCDIKKLPGIYELLRNLVIFRTWIGVQAGVVVSHNNIGSVTYDSLTKHFGGSQN